MNAIKIIVCLAIIWQQQYWVQANTASLKPYTTTGLASENAKKDESASSNSPIMGALYRKSRQQRCVRCYDDRYSNDRTGYSSGYASRTADDRGNWYYPQFDRYDERYRGAEYDRTYRDRDDRHSSRTYDRYDVRGGGGVAGAGAGGYDRYDTRGTAGYDRYDTRGAGGYDRYDTRGTAGYDRYDERRPAYGRYDDDRRDYGESRGYGYEMKDRYGADRYYDRYRQGGSSTGYDRDYYDRYYSRYDFRNYRPWDETYRGQSGFDISGRGYYFAGNDNDQRYGMPQDTAHREATPCGVQVPNCPYGNTLPVRVSSSSIDSGSQTHRGGTTHVYSSDNSHNNENQNHNSNNNNDNTSSKKPNSWSYLDDKDGNNKNSQSKSTTSNTSSRENEQQSSPYGSRPPPRPLSGSYLFDRDTNAQLTGSNAANSSDQTADTIAPNDGSSAGNQERQESSIHTNAAANAEQQ